MNILSFNPNSLSIVTEQWKSFKNKDLFKFGKNIHVIYNYSKNYISFIER